MQRFELTCLDCGDSFPVDYIYDGEELGYRFDPSVCPICGKKITVEDHSTEMENN